MSNGKQKTHSGAAKRFRKTAGGYRHRSANRSHLLTGMGRRRKRRLRTQSMISRHNLTAVRRMLGD